MYSADNIGRTFLIINAEKIAIDFYKVIKLFGSDIIVSQVICPTDRNMLANYDDESTASK